MSSKKLGMQIKDIPLKSIVLACKDFHEQGGDTPLERLVKGFNAPEKLICCAMEKAYSKGYLECGTSIRTAWLTDKGHKFLLELKKSKYEMISKNGKEI